MPTLTRRAVLKNLGWATAAGAYASLVRPLGAVTAVQRQPVPDDRERVAIAVVAQQFMARYDVPGLSVAFARHGQLVYEEGFGVANRSSSEKLTPAHVFRIASLSKPITSVAIFSLIEAGRFKLDDLVFGPLGLLQDDYGRDLPASVAKITLHHLLTHTSGGWQNDGTDPMFRHTDYKHRELIAWTLAHQPLAHQPGTHYAYSNFGYCILGRVVEKFGQMPYADYVREHVLAKCGIADMKIAGNRRVDRAAGEVAYYDQKPEAPYGMNVARMDSHGGWIATPGDLVKFLTRVDGFSAERNILMATTIRTMTTPTTAGPRYACGWSVNQVPNWWHGGSLPGTATIAVRTASGLCWAGFTNRRAEGIGGELDRLMWKMAKAVPAWHA